MESLSSRGPGLLMRCIGIITSITFVVLVIVKLALNLEQLTHHPNDYFEPNFVFYLVVVLGLFGLVICLETVLFILLLKGKWNAEAKKCVKQVNWWIYLNLAILVLLVIGAFVWTSYIIIIVLLVRVVMFSFAWHCREELNQPTIVNDNFT